MRIVFFLAFLSTFLLGSALPVMDEEVTYRSGNQIRKAYLSRPKGAGPFPAAIYNHGGLGATVGGAPGATCEALAGAGFVGFSPIRRTEISMEGNLQDVLLAIDYVKDLEFVDPNRIALIGFSRGGLLTLMAATQRPDLRAIVVMAAAPGKGHAERLLREVDRITAPVLLMVAENDRVQADHVRLMRRFKEALESTNQEVELILYPPYGSDGHRMFFEVGGYWPDVVEFLKEHLS